MFTVAALWGHINGAVLWDHIYSTALWDHMNSVVHWDHMNNTALWYHMYSASLWYHMYSAALWYDMYSDTLWDHMNRPIICRSHHTDKSTKMTFEPGFHAQNTNIITTTPILHYFNEFLQTERAII